MTDSTGGNVLGATTTTAGVAMLPNTSGSSVLTILAIAAITLGVATLLTTVGAQLYRRLF